MSKQLTVLSALKMLIERALTGADVRGLANDADLPQRIPPNGMVIIRDGDPGDATVDLCPPTYHYEHQIPVEMAAYSNAADLRETLHDMASRIGAAIARDRFLGGLCHFVEVTPLLLVDLAAVGAPTQLGGTFNILATYSTTNPLG